MKYEITSTPAFDKWFANLKDSTTKNKVLARINRTENGNFGDIKQLGNSLAEMRFFFGGGLRIYYTIQDQRLVLLLRGSNKSTQSKEIAKARKMIKDLE